VFVLALVSQLVFHSSIDPTEQSFAVTLHNDTPSAVTVKQCDVKCDSFHELDHLLPGASVRVNTSSGNVANWWAITDSAGRTVGCLPLRYDHKIDGLVVNVSDHTACPVGTSASGSNILGSIIGFALLFLVVGISVPEVVPGLVELPRESIGTRVRPKSKDRMQVATSDRSRHQKPDGTVP
jgi:hypothetical protein